MHCCKCTAASALLQVHCWAHVLVTQDTSALAVWPSGTGPHAAGQSAGLPSKAATTRATATDQALLTGCGSTQSYAPRATTATRWRGPRLRGPARVRCGSADRLLGPWLCVATWQHVRVTSAAFALQLTRVPGARVAAHDGVAHEAAELGRLLGFLVIALRGLHRQLRRRTPRHRTHTERLTHAAAAMQGRRCCSSCCEAVAAQQLRSPYGMAAGALAGVAAPFPAPPPVTS